MKLASNTELDDSVYKWFTRKRAQGGPISGPILCEKAVQFNEKLGGTSNFQASTGWLKRFKSQDMAFVSFKYKEKNCLLIRSKLN